MMKNIMKPIAKTEGDTVKAGQPLIRFDRDKIKAANHPDMVVLLTNSDDYEQVELKTQATAQA